MGMDLYIFRARTKKAFSEEDWYNSESVTQLFYARKWWDLVDHCSFIPKDYESGDYIQLTKENFEEMIKIACEYKDYFDSYQNIPRLCELRDTFDDDEEKGYHYYLEYDW